MINKVKHFIVNILSMPIRNKNKRKNFRRTLMHYRFVDIFHYLKFAYHKVEDNAVLLIETNTCHGEVIAGYLRYFQDLGYKVDILINSDVLNEKPFCRLDMKNVGVFHCYFPFFKFCFRSSNIKKYKHVFLMTTAGYYLKPDENDYDAVICKWPELKRLNSLFVVEHDLKDVDRFNEKELIDNNKLIKNNYLHT